MSIQVPSAHACMLLFFAHMNWKFKLKTGKSWLNRNVDQYFLAQFTYQGSEI